MTTIPFSNVINPQGFNFIDDLEQGLFDYVLFEASKDEDCKIPILLLVDIDEDINPSVVLEWCNENRDYDSLCAFYSIITEPSELEIVFTLEDVQGYEDLTELVFEKNKNKLPDDWYEGLHTEEYVMNSFNHDETFDHRGNVI